MRLHPDLVLERQLRKEGFASIAGLDEAGRGAWAGPLTAAAVILPLERPDLAEILHGVRDSKQMTPAQRFRWAGAIREVAVAIGVGHCLPEEVDDLGPLVATRLAMERALAGLSLVPEHLLIDYLRLPEVSLPQTSLPQGDARVLSIAAASVIAKVTRDQWMVSLEEAYPGYGFARHKGYGTPEHRGALALLGPCPLHRMSFAPVASLPLFPH
jgi:ribonuclease HII